MIKISEHQLQFTFKGYAVETKKLNAEKKFKELTANPPSDYEIAMMCIFPGTLLRQFCEFKNIDVEPQACIEFKDWELVIRSLKHVYEYFVDLQKEYDNGKEDCTETFLMYQEILNNYEEMWPEIKPVSFTEIFEMENATIQRELFKLVPPGEIFKASGPVLLDRKEVKKEQMRWDKLQPGKKARKGRKVKYTDVLEFYSLDASKVFRGESRPVRGTLYAIKVECPSKGSEHWLLLNPDEVNEKSTAIEAICSTLKIPIKNPVELYRQGDVVMWKEPEHEEVQWHTNSNGDKISLPITVDQYLNLMKAES